MYGPAETSVWATFAQCQPDGSAPTIGTPIANVNVYILDRDLNLAPIGQPGEICIGGVAVGPGYFNNPDLTRVRFQRDPYTDDPAARIYLTGDRGVRLNDGNVAFLGRADDQVKLHGCRIELGEIEHALLALPEVESAAALLHDAGQKSARLLAFVKLRRGVPSEERALRDALRARLPSYMLPSQICVLDSWPRLPSGKTDRHQLARHVPLEPSCASDTARTDTERHVVAAMARVLDIDPLRIGRNDDFFSHGGHSLHVVTLAHDLAQRTRVSVPTAVLLSNPCVADLAQFIDEAQLAGRDATD